MLSLSRPQLQLSKALGCSCRGACGVCLPEAQSLSLPWLSYIVTSSWSSPRLVVSKRRGLSCSPGAACALGGSVQFWSTVL